MLTHFTLLTGDTSFCTQQNVQHTSTHASSTYTYKHSGALNLQGIEFARKGGGNCKERNTQGKVPQFASVWICKEWNYPGNQEVESARNSICKERNLQGMEIARNGGGIYKEWTLQGMRTMLCLSQFRSRQYLACYPLRHVRVWVVLVSGCF